jgi:chromosome segregation ATPase
MYDLNTEQIAQSKEKLVARQNKIAQKQGVLRQRLSEVERRERVLQNYASNLSTLKAKLDSGKIELEQSLPSENARIDAEIAELERRLEDLDGELPRMKEVCAQKAARLERARRKRERRSQHTDLDRLKILFRRKDEVTKKIRQFTDVIATHNRDRDRFAQEIMALRQIEALLKNQTAIEARNAAIRSHEMTKKLAIVESIRRTTGDVVNIDAYLDVLLNRISVVKADNESLRLRLAMMESEREGVALSQASLLEKSLTNSLKRTRERMKFTFDEFEEIRDGKKRAREEILENDSDLKSRCEREIELGLELIEMNFGEMLENVRDEIERWKGEEVEEELLEGWQSVLENEACDC